MMNRTPSRKTVKSSVKEEYRVEGLGRRGAIRYVKVMGSPGAWRITGLNGLRVEVGGRTVHDAVRLARRKIPFRPIVIRRVDAQTSEPLPGGAPKSPGRTPPPDGQS